MKENFADRLIDAVREKQNPSVVGLDPRIEHIPDHLKNKHCNNEAEAVADAFIAFNKLIIDAIYDIVPAVKPQIAFYEQYRHYGIIAFEETVNYAKSKGLTVVADAKRNDIGSTAEAYADAYLGRPKSCTGSLVPGFDVDAITVNAYLGKDGIKPFIKSCHDYGKGIFILAKTSNSSSGDLQDLFVGEQTVYERMALLIAGWGEEIKGEYGYSSIGMVVGATFPEQAAKLRKLVPQSIFLVPGYGAQGGSAEDIIPCFNDDGLGAIVNSSRAVIFAYMDKHWKGQYSPEQFDSAARAAAVAMKNDIMNTINFSTKSCQRGFCQ